ncbi:cell division protein PerM [Microbacterium phyllosphaerae]|uniref:cell division protein PerM n=1 Tax=Microbacterium phyllosphaerae TaxID=124798 RepID=UPI003D64F5D5
MQRLLVALLAAFDAAIAAAVGLVVLLAPLTLLWTLAFGVTADWGALWPLTGTLWQFGHGVPLDVDVTADVLRATGIAPAAAAFTLSVTPLAFLLFTLLFAARSGARAARAGAWLLGALSGALTFGIIATGVALTSTLSAAQTALVPAILLPTAVYLVGAVCGAVRIAWEDGDGGFLDRVHDVVDSWGDWGPVPSAAVRGAAFALVGVTAVSALAVALMTLTRGGEVVALFQAARVDALGAGVITLGHLAYLPTIIVWAASWLAGPGFAVGVGTAVSPAGTQLGVVPGIPVLGLLPEATSMWMLIVILLPIGAGAFAGWAVRSRLVWEGTPLGTGPRAAIAGGIGVLTAVVAALAALVAGGSMGPGRLAEAGPAVLPFALALGGEVLLGAAILLLSPRHRDELAEERTDRWVAEMTASDLAFDDSTDRVPAATTWPGAPSAFDTATLGDDGGFRLPKRDPDDPLR